jgi:hypothetical protein
MSYRSKKALRRLPILTVGEYADSSSVPKNGPLRFGFSGAQRDAARRKAARLGWTIRTNPRGWIKVFDKNGNVSFALSTNRAVYGLSASLALVNEMSKALMAIRKQTLKALYQEMA